MGHVKRSVAVRLFRPSTQTPILWPHTQPALVTFRATLKPNLFCSKHQRQLLVYFGGNSHNCDSTHTDQPSVYRFQECNTSVVSLNTSNQVLNRSLSSCFQSFPRDSSFLQWYERQGVADCEFQQWAFCILMGG